MRAASVQASADSMQCLPSSDVLRSGADCALELPQRLPPAPLLEVDPTEIHEGELPRLVAFGLLGLREPGDGLLELALLHQVDPDVVIRIAELGVDLDRPQTLLGRLLQSALCPRSPPGGRVEAHDRVDHSA